ncbi:MAG: hypothetical protein LBE39_11315 [Flavobacteriaceae bacterium]|jgi:hypothetical protein|nr:hypothetical protein [Flavobacteriaceae bacterium]
MFKVKGQLFDIKHAYLCAFRDDNQLIFSLQIKATGKDKYPKDEEADTTYLFYQEDELWFNSEILLKINPNQIKKWQDIVGQKVEWEDYSEDEGNPRALFYVYEHKEVYNANIEFKNIDNKIVVSVKASCCIYAGEELPLEIETQIEFYGILCGKATEEQCRKRIEPFLNLDTLKFVQNKYGVSIMVPQDTNMGANLLILGDDL